MIEPFLQIAADKNVKLVAVSKTHPVERILEVYQHGQRIFGENRAQEMQVKHSVLPKDIEWHMIGHLQTNKVKYIASFVQMIHSVDSLTLLLEINKQGQKYNRTIDCLLQFHIASETTKFGFDLSEAEALLKTAEFHELTNIRICGVMGMATFTDDKTLVRNEFKTLKTIFTHLKQTYFKDSDFFTEISMGMSDDWEIAVEEGSTMIRIGSLIFGNRSYNI
ncbi:MAG: YggS family pyridoxal phosphate-dependent enzyme [Saprospiraceae bacterium]|nr:YggS family pyridoxal phosphate-dependent enzyme [Saprospiraceae bacterium]